MRTINLHLGRFADDDKVWTNAGVNFYKGVRCDAVTPFFHIAEVINGGVFQQTQFVGDPQTMHHTGRGSLLIASAASRTNPQPTPNQSPHHSNRPARISSMGDRMRTLASAARRATPQYNKTGAATNNSEYPANPEPR